MNKLIFILIAFLYGYSQTNIRSTSLTTSVDKNQITIGEKINLIVQLSQPKIDDQAPISLPLLRDRLGDFVIKDYEILKTEADSTSDHQQKIVYQVTTFKIGRTVIPSIELIDRDQKITSQPIDIEVVSLLNSNEVEVFLEEVKLDDQLTGKLNRNLYYLLIALIITLSIYLIYRYIKSRIKPPPVPFYIAILENLESLGNQLPLKGNLKKSKRFYYRLYELIKIFLSHQEKQRKILSMTSHQFERNYRKKKLKNFDFYLNFFLYADQVKFTSFIPDEKHSRDSLSQFKLIVIAYKKELESKKSSDKNK